MKYRLVFGRRRRTSTSKRLRRISTSSVPAADGSRKVVLRAKPAKAAEPAREPAREPMVAPVVTPPSPRMSPRVAAPASILDRVRVEAVIAEDGATRVCRVVERKTGRRFTLTTCELANAGEWEAWDRFGHECRVVRSLAHPGVPRYVEHAQTDTTGVLLTEHIEGRTLAERMARDERYSDLKLRHILSRALDVLAYLHELNPPVFHCDVHPGAIVVSDRGDVTLISFGRARSRLAGDDDRVEPTGRDGYVPADARRFVASAATDIWALGATMLAVASGRDAAALPHRDGVIDIDACMKPSPLRDAIRSLLAAEPDACIAAAQRVRALLRERR